MKRIISLLLAVFLLTTAAVAQKNVQRAFDKFVNYKKVRVDKELSSQYDPFPTGKKGEHQLISQCDIYTFTLNTADRKLLDKILIQIEEDRDSETCYQVKKHRGGKESPREQYKCLVGDGMQNYLIIGQNVLDNWSMACYISAENLAYRHLFAVEWQEPQDDQEEIKGRLIHTYAKKPAQEGNILMNGQPFSIKSEVRTELAFLLHFVILQNNYERYLASKDNGPVLFIRSVAIYELCRDSGHLVKDAKKRKHIIEELNQLFAKTTKSQEAQGYLLLAIQEMQE